MSEGLTDEQIGGLLRGLDDVPPASPEFFSALRTNLERSVDTEIRASKPRGFKPGTLTAAVAVACLAIAATVVILRTQQGSGGTESAACGLALTYKGADYVGQHVTLSRAELGPSAGRAVDSACADAGQPSKGGASIPVRRIRGVDPLVELAVTRGQLAGVYVRQGVYPQAQRYPVRMPQQRTGHGCTLGAHFSFVGRVVSLGYTYPDVRIIRMVSGEAFRPADVTVLYVSPETTFLDSSEYPGAGQLRLGETIRVAARGCQVPGAARPRPIPVRIADIG